MVSHDQKSYVMPNLNDLDPGNVVVSLIMPLASHDTNTNDITDQTKSCSASF